MRCHLVVPSVLSCLVQGLQCVSVPLDYSGLMVGFLFGLILVLVMLGKHHSASIAQLHLFKLRSLPPFHGTRHSQGLVCQTQMGRCSFCNTRFYQQDVWCEDP